MNSYSCWRCGAINNLKSVEVYFVLSLAGHCTQVIRYACLNIQDCTDTLEDQLAAVKQADLIHLKIMEALPDRQETGRHYNKKETKKPNGTIGRKNGRPTQVGG